MKKLASFELGLTESPECVIFEEGFVFDRRNPAQPDRRAISRGSRRCTDAAGHDRPRFKTVGSC